MPGRALNSGDCKGTAIVFPLASVSHDRAGYGKQT